MTKYPVVLNISKSLYVVFLYACVTNIYFVLFLVVLDCVEVVLNVNNIIRVNGD